MEPAAGIDADAREHRRPAPGARIAWVVAAGMVALLVVAAFLRFHRDGYGFTYVLDFGGTLGLPRLAEVDGAPAYIHPQVAGYDGQMYAQLALRPAANDPELARVLDNPPYRARRMLMPWIAHAAGLGRPSWVLQVQALLNLVSWFALGLLLLRWFRPGRWVDLVRWAGVMLSAGVLSSLRHALTDGPALLAIAACLALVECGRRRSAVVVGALAGLTRETAVLAGAALAPASPRDLRGWGRLAIEGAVLLAPLLLWMWHVRGLAGASAYQDGGFANFTWPLAGFAGRWTHLVEVLVERGWMRTIGFSLLLQAAITVQVVFIVARPRWGDPWWRVAAAHVVLLAFLNSQVWEDHPGAAARVLLPLLLAFNRLVPGRGAWVAILVAGNLSVFSGLVEMRAPPREIVRVVEVADGALRENPAALASLDFGNGFLVLEGSGDRAWRWTSGDAAVRLSNHAGRPLRATLRATLRSRGNRTVEVRAGAGAVGSWEVGPVRREFASAPFSIPPEGVAVEFLAGEPQPGPVGDPRVVAVEFSRIELDVEAGAAAP